MGFIREPEGVDFIIQSRPLTDEDRKVITEYIRQSKEKEKARLEAEKQARKAKRQQATARRVAKA